MKVKDLKEILQKINDDVEVGIMTDQNLSKDVLMLIQVLPALEMNGDQFILYRVGRNYVTMNELAEYEKQNNKDSESSSK